MVQCFVENKKSRSYYEEKNPYGSGQAHGTLSIKKFSHIENGSNHYYVTYAGYMYWYD